MIRIDEQVTRAPAATAFQIAADVERWPDILPHYRWVRFRSRRSFGRGIVEMAAHRDFGTIRWPTWWVSEMDVDPHAPVIRYRHIEGITRGMVVRWEFFPSPDGQTRIRIIHEWSGPRWPLISRPAASLVIGPHFVSAIAQRTLAGVCATADAEAPTRRDTPAHSAGPRQAPARREAPSPTTPPRRERQPHA